MPHDQQYFRDVYCDLVYHYINIELYRDNTQPLRVQYVDSSHQLCPSSSCFIQVLVISC